MSETDQIPEPNVGASGRPRRMTWWRRVVFGIGAPLSAFVLRLWWAIYRFELHESEAYLELERRQQPVVFAIWHEGLLTVCWYTARLLKRGVKATFLISPSVDGEIGVMLLAQFGSRAVRGSARRSGAAALRRLCRAMTEIGQSPFITLDGSKGPRRHCKPGAIMVARMAGAPIVPIGVAARRSWRAPTWDRHLVPKPLSKVVITVGDPITVPRRLRADGVETRRLELEERVNRLMEISEGRVGVREEVAPVVAGRTEEDA
jgi:lysophospholipid acyltransferase (LPLAT)-like uncharacterized protein